MKHDVVIEGLVKTYDDHRLTALADIDLKVAPGALFGLIGPDGAGKTSLFRILTTLLLPDSGRAQVHSWDVIKDYQHIRSHVGYMPGRFSLYQDLTVEENLRFFATIFNTTIEANYHLIEDIYSQIEPFRKRRAGNLSGGMKQKLALSCALIHRPKVLFLDEPTTGVDTVSRKEFWQMLKRLKSEGITILVSTPYMDEANLCERIALIQHGRIMSVDTPEAIIRDYPEPLFAVQSNAMIRLLALLREMPAVTSVQAFGEWHHLTLADDTERGRQQLMEQLTTHGHTGIRLQPITPTIEDCFIQLMTKTSAHDQ